MVAADIDTLRAAHKAYEDGLKNLAFDLYKKLADKGHVDSQIFIAWMLNQGIGCIRNQILASSYYEKAASLGSPLGCFYFGRWLTKNGNHAAAYEQYLRGSAANHLPSKFRVGYSLARGHGITANLPLAYDVLIGASSRGHAYAIRELGIQDLRGGRGGLYVLVGLFELVAALIWGVGVACVRSDSELLLG